MGGFLLSFGMVPLFFVPNPTKFSAAMCGIALQLVCRPLQQEQHHLQSCWRSIIENNVKRGPDSCSTFEFEWQSNTNENAVALSLTSSVLGLRGSTVTQQPLQSQDGRFILAWNGQIFDWSTNSTSKHKIHEGENDGHLLFQDILLKLDQVSPSCSSQSAATLVNQAVVSTFAQIEGPYAFVFLDRANGHFVFGRDPLGRRSLLISQPSSNVIMLASVSSKLAKQHHLEFKELDCSCLWSVNVLSDPFSVEPLERNSSLATRLVLKEVDNLTEFTQDPIEPRSLQDRISSAKEFQRILEKSVQSRVTRIRSHQTDTDAHIAILFSGGLDCATLARLADQFIPLQQPIDLLNVAFENPRAIRSARLEAQKAHARAEKHRKRATQTRSEARVATLATEKDSCPNPLEDKDTYSVPDRVTGRSTHDELVRLAPHRRWNFVEINIPYQEYCDARQEVEALMYPASSIMDLSIASALYFASRGRGTIVDATTAKSVEYTTTAKVLISGLGADELLGGYSRHRNAFHHHGWNGLVNELQLDLDRLPTRNLGRDDRVMSIHGRESRYPFLDRTVVEYLTDLPVLHKLDPRMAEGVGDKLLLRDVCHHHLGLTVASQWKKRAMQFGTRSAKIDDDQAKLKGHELIQS